MISASGSVSRAFVFGLMSMVYSLWATLCLGGATNLPAWSTRAVMVDSNGVFAAPAGVVSSNGLALQNPPVLLASEPFTAWGTADGVTWTNASGWTSTAPVTNGLADLSVQTNSVVSPIFTNAGFRDLVAVWSNLDITAVYEASTNAGSTWFELATLTNSVETWAAYQVRISATNTVPEVPGTTNYAMLDAVTLTGHRFPARIGVETNDFSGIVIRVDNPVGSRDAVNLQTLDTRLAAVEQTISSPTNWALYPAVQAVDLAGHPLDLDSRYTSAISNDVLSLTFAGQPVWDVLGGGTVTPSVVYFSLSGGTQIAMRVSGSADYRPYPQWSSDLIATNWTSYATNAFSSTYPALTNGLYTLEFPAVTNSPAYYRVIAIGEGTNTLQVAFRVPVQFDGPVSGAGLGGLVATQQLDGYVTTNVMPGYATTGSVAWLRDHGAIGFSIGSGASVDPVAGGIAVGVGSLATNGVSPLALGDSATADGNASLALGLFAACVAPGSSMATMQIGQGTNSTEGTLKFRGYRLLEADGTIPNARHSGWSGIWTNIQDNVTNLLQFGNGIATNKVTL